jgi:bifunctional UDP-N-acetylglucosamine pyrophosphorylase / glucosamine-1-phosphate N-acetyltransferase
MNSKITGLILAAGKGTRMKDENPKVLQELFGKSMLEYVMDSMVDSGVTRIIPILGFKYQQVVKQLSLKEYALQEEQLGTGHAVLQAIPLLKDEDLILIMAGDQPLIRAESISKLIQKHHDNNNDLTLLTTVLDDPYGYGRILKEGNQVVGMVEEWDATDQERRIKEVNLSTYLFKAEILKSNIHKITNNNKKAEYYINDLVGILFNQGKKIETVIITDVKESIGINDKVALATASEFLQERINQQHMLNGVSMIQPKSIIIGPDVMIGPGTVIYPNSVMEGKTIIGKNCIIKSSYISNSQLGDHVTVGPYANIRQQSIIGNQVRVGNFVEVKNSLLNDGVKAAHLTYLGDSEIGTNVNIGCGVITVNYDGEHKHKTIIGDNSFIGSNVNLIAPLTIGNNVTIAAGSTITEDVSDDSLAIARERQTTKEGYYKSHAKVKSK